MPGADGYDLIRTLRALPPEEGGRIPAVAVTGYANQGDRQRALTAGYQSHVAKPIDANAVVIAVSRAATQGGISSSRGQG
jgi:CheY-like chemotaxis protein